MKDRSQPRRGGLGCILITLVFIAVIGFAVWAWFQPGGDMPSYWH